MTDSAPRWYCTACGAVSVRPDRCPECGSESRLDVLGVVPGIPAIQRIPGALAQWPRLTDTPDEVRREADRVVKLWSKVKAERDAQVDQVRRFLVGKEVDVPFGATASYAVSPVLQQQAPRWRRRMVLAVHQGGQQVDRIHPNGDRERHAVRLNLPAARALVLGIDPSRPLVWAPIPWLRIPE